LIADDLAKAGLTAGLLFWQAVWQFLGEAFSCHSQNKIGGTADSEEHRRSPLVVGAGNAST
jgi:hypothetical protein